MNKPSVQGTISATAASAVTKIGRRHILLKNNGSKTVYVRLNDKTATTSDFAIVAGATVTLDCNFGDVIYSVVTICGGADATTLNYLAWN